MKTKQMLDEIKEELCTSVKLLNALIADKVIQTNCEIGWVDVLQGPYKQLAADMIKNPSLYRVKPSYKYRPWLKDEAIGQTVVSKALKGVYIIISAYDTLCVVGPTQINYTKLLEEYVTLYGEPCGVKCES